MAEKLSACIDHGKKLGHNDYALVQVNGRRMGMHVYALMKATGEPPDGRQCLHSCDNPRCINPSHLRWGSISENMTDAYKRGRRFGKQGSQNPAAILTEDQVRAIKYTELGTQREIAFRYGIQPSKVSMIRSGKIWKHV